jgi:hypothetical protein
MKTSVWLDDETAAEWKASGLALAELVKRGLKADEPEPLDDKIGRLLDERLAPIIDRLDAKPDRQEACDTIRAELLRAAGRSYD